METIPVGTTSRVITWAEPSALDDSGVTPVLVQTHQPGDTFDVGFTIVTYTFTDGSGNSAECTFIVTISKFFLRQEYLACMA